MKKFFWVLITVAAIAITGCDKNDDLMDDELTPPENKEQIRTQDENKKDSVPPGHHPENDDDDPYGGKYDPIWRQLLNITALSVHWSQLQAANDSNAADCDTSDCDIFCSPDFITFLHHHIALNENQRVM